MTGHCRIRSVRDDDLHMLLDWRNHPSVRSYMLTQHQIGVEEHSAWFAEASTDVTRQLLIVEQDGEPFGYVQFANVSDGGVADWGFYVRPNSPKGSGARLGVATLDYAFEVLNLHKICGQAIASNSSSIALHQKLGFVQEGVFRDQQRIEGVYHSLICFGLLRHEWRVGWKI